MSEQVETLTVTRLPGGYYQFKATINRETIDRVLLATVRQVVGYIERWYNGKTVIWNI